MPNVITDITIPCQHIHWDFFPQLFQENTSILVVPRSCLPFGFPSTGHEQPAHTGQGGDLDSRSEIWERRRVYFHVGVWLGSSGHLPSPSPHCSTLECPCCQNKTQTYVLPSHLFKMAFPCKNGILPTHSTQDSHQPGKTTQSDFEAVGW